MDGISILLDGACSKVEPYAETPMAVLDALSNNYPDAVGFTHRHPDHFLNSFVCDYEKETGRQAWIAAECSATVGAVQWKCFPTRHLGRAEEGLFHSSFLISGSKTILFTGDAAPASVRGIKANVVIAPFAYANTVAGLKAVEATGAKDFILVHMPEEQRDAYGIWDSVNKTLSDVVKLNIHIPEIGETVYL